MIRDDSARPELVLFYDMFIPAATPIGHDFRTFNIGKAITPCHRL